MFKYSVSIILIYFINLFPQNIDSLSVINDSSNVTANTDTTFSINDTTEVNKTDSLSKTESIVPIQMQPLTETSFIIGRQDFLFNDYRYTGDFLKQFPLTFTQDLGFVGYPNNSFLYGIGNGGVSYLMDGVLWNDRFFNSLDLNLIQSEDIDSIEIVPLPRGFLYGPVNNAVTVNFIPRDFVSQAPYSRIKYYEGPDGEAMIDGKFNALVMKRWNFSFEVTNRGKDSTYTNSEFSIWQANAKLKYFLSNEINFAAEYRFNHLKRGLNDGVNVDSIRQITTDINSILYDPLQAPVNSPFRKQEILHNYFVLKTLIKSIEGSELDLQFYYKDDLEKNKSLYSTIYPEVENKIFGAKLNYSQRIGIFSAQVISNFDKNNLTFTSTNSWSVGFNYISAAGILSMSLLNGIIKPSVYYKYFNQDYTWADNNSNEGKSGFGGDVNFQPIKELSIYVGYSVFNQFEVDNSRTIEFGAMYKTEDLTMQIKYFRKENHGHYSISVPVWTGIEIGIPQYSFDGIGGYLKYKIWKILIEANNFFYFNTDPDLFWPPQNQIISGLYLNDFFFDNNLSLKTGFKFHYTGVSEIYPIKIDPSNRLDFNLFGEIQERAIIYFVWENLFNKKYYITPYFPMPERNIRFGVAWELFN